MITTVDGITEEGLCLFLEGFCPGEFYSREFSPGRDQFMGSFRGESVCEAASCSYHIIIWYL